MDKWQKGRDAHFKKMLNGESKFYNFDYRNLWVMFQDKNIEAIEAEEDKSILEDFCEENNYFSRVVLGNHYENCVQRFFYCVLTIFKRVGKNEISTIWGSCEYSFPTFLSFYLGNYEDQWEKEMEDKWGEYLANDVEFGGYEEPMDFIPEGFIDDMED